jgi:hypothetical protein
MIDQRDKWTKVQVQKILPHLKTQKIRSQYHKEKILKAISLKENKYKQARKKAQAKLQQKNLKKLRNKNHNDNGFSK